jgi:hypothetical protein
MASFNQDFRKFQKDTFEIVFTITDATTSIASYYAWWGVYSAVPDNYPGDGSAPINTPILQKSTSTPFNTGPSATGGIVMGVSTVTISIQQSDFNGEGDTGVLDEAEWYHELVIGESIDASDSVVAAIGTMTISPSLFTNNLYRW